MTQTVKIFAASALASLFALTAVMPEESGAGATLCVGGAQEYVNSTTNNAVASNFSPVATQMPYSYMNASSNGAAGDTDLYTVTWSGQSSSLIGYWTAQAQIRINVGAFINMDPVGPNKMYSGTNTMTWCKRMAADVRADVRIIWAKVGVGSVTIDNYVTRLEQSN